MLSYNTGVEIIPDPRIGLAIDLLELSKFHDRVIALTEV